ncbi:MAG: FliH/SctL family protein [Actinomycetes bacterium]
MSPDLRFASYVPASIGTPRAVDGDGAHAAGFAAGWAAGARAAAEEAVAQARVLRAEHERAEAARAAELASTVQALVAAIERWERRAHPVLADAEATLHDAALALAEAVLAHEIRTDPDGARVLLARALALPDGITPVRVRLHPADCAAIEALGPSAALPERVDLVPDPRLERGDAVTEYDDGALDARISTALDRARRALSGEEPL